ncbi:PA14 domain-containing protein [Gryllotalpicola reticulitermitis]|uniref:PA14 domain-containing protein n=1 Tax=Gryllotalpicola reticulitermitis TaxID=1184153 RepID=A0ABV8Q7N3_9MICO
MRSDKRRRNNFSFAIWCVVLTLVIIATATPITGDQAQAVTPGHSTAPGSIHSPRLSKRSATVPRGTFTSTSSAKLPEAANEITADRTASTSTWQNSDGSLSIREYDQPHFYKPQGSSSWTPIDSSLTRDAGRDDPSWHSGANNWEAEFGPLDTPGGSERLDDGVHPFGFAPVGTSDPTLVPTVSASTATYPSLWPDTDIIDNVQPAGISEDVVLKSVAAPFVFDFNLTGATLSGGGDGTVKIEADGAPVAIVPAPMVALSDTASERSQAVKTLPATVADADAVVTAKDATTLELSVSAEWLKSLPVSAFPVTIDPTVSYTEPNIAEVDSNNDATTSTVSWSSTGSKVTGEVEVGPNASTGVTWVGAAYFTRPQPPAPTNGGPAWQLSHAAIEGDCEPSTCGLKLMNVYGLTLAQSTTPTYTDITSAQNLPTTVGGTTGTAVIGSFDAELTPWFMGKSGSWLGFSGIASTYSGHTTSPVIFKPTDFYTTFYYYQNVKPTTITQPAAGSSLATTTPTFEAAQVSPWASGESVWYDFKLSTQADGSGTEIDSGWLSSNYWTPDVGSLQNGLTYYATVSDSSIDPSISTTDDGYVPPATPPTAIPIKINLHLGSGGSSPTDTVGNSAQGTTTPSQGAPNPGTSPSSETVNLVTGDLALTVGTHSLQAASGQATLALNYNSLSSSTSASASGGTNYGLVGAYFLDPNNAHVYPSNEVGQRTDANINLSGEYGTSIIGGVPSGANGYLIRWTGYITLPSGTWDLGGKTTGGMRIYLNGSTLPTYDDWSGSATDATPSYSTNTVAGGQQYQIEIDDWEAYGNLPSVSTWVQLWAKNTASGAASPAIVPSSWLTPTTSSLPSGWSLSADAANGTWTQVVDDGSQVIATATTGQTTTFTQLPSGAYQAPAGDDDHLARDGNGDLQLSTADNTLYTFNADGSLASYSTATDDGHPATLQYGYGGTPSSLQTITDPVSGRIIHLYYGGNANCPLSDPAPSGMLCDVSWWDGDSTTFAYNTNGQISGITDPGNTTTLFGYDSSDRIDDIRDALASDYIASGRPDVPAACTAASTSTSCDLDTIVNYDVNGRVLDVEQPAPTPGGTPPLRSYNYGSGSTTMLVDGQSATAGYSRDVTYDSKNEILTDAQWQQNPTESAWDSDGRQIVSVTPAGLQTSTVYDASGDVTDTYGPAPKACFTSAWPSGASTPYTYTLTGYLPAADPASVSGCATTVPHTTSTYTPNGLTASYWSNSTYAGTPVTVGPASTAYDSDYTGCDGQTLCMAWASPPVPLDASGEWSLKDTGGLVLPQAQTLTLALASEQPASLWIDGSERTSLTSAQTSGSLWSTSNSATLTLAAGFHSIEVDYLGAGGENNGFEVDQSTASGWAALPDSDLVPVERETDTLAATYWPNANFAGTPSLLGESAAPANSAASLPSGSLCGTGPNGTQATDLCMAWSGVPFAAGTAQAWSVRLTGTLNLASAQSMPLALMSDRPASMWVDGAEIADVTADQVDNSDTGLAEDADNALTLSAGAHQFEIDFVGEVGTAPNEAAVYLNEGTYPQILNDALFNPGFHALTGTTDPDGDTTQTDYSSPDGVLGPWDGLATQSIQDPGGLNLVTATGYDDSGSGAYDQKASSTLPAGNTTSFSYYPGTGGPIAAVCGASSTTPQGGLLESEIDPAPAAGQPAREQQYVYDNAGRMVGERTGTTAEIDTEGWQCTSYDARGRIISETIPGNADSSAGRTITYSYRVGGDPLQSSVTDSRSNITITSLVDLLGRVITYDDNGHTSTVSYNRAGEVVATSGPQGNVYNTYDDTGRLVTVQSPAQSAADTLATVQYDATGRTTKTIYGNGTTATETYDSHGNENAIEYTKTSTGAVIGGEQATYSDASRLTTNLVASGGTFVNPNPAGVTASDYDYDAAGRLTQSWLVGEQQSYWYGGVVDWAPNCMNWAAGENTDRTVVTTIKNNVATGTFTCYNNADQPTQTSTNAGPADSTGGVPSITNSTAYAFDEYGNQTDDQGTLLTWDSSGRVTQTTTPAGVTTSSTYDPLDRLATQQQSGASPSTVDYVYAGLDDDPVATEDASGTVVQQYISLPGGIEVTVQASNAQTWSYPDLQGNVTLTTNGSGAQQGAAIAYDPWGTVISGGDAPNGNGISDFGGFGADGKLTSDATGFILLGSREFNPAEARFLSVDPTQGGCANPYTYAHGDPLAQVDLNGQFCWKTALGIGLGIASVALGVLAIPLSGGLSIGLAIAGVAAGVAATSLDLPGCFNQDDGVACTGLAFGAAGAAIGAGGVIVDGIAAEGSNLALIGTAADTQAAMFGGTGTLVDTAAAATAKKKKKGC